MKKKNKEKRILIKMLLCLVYLIIITLLFVGSYQMYQEKEELTPWGEVKNTNEYTYMDIYKMSEKFAFYEETNVGIHFVIEKEDTGQWHTYIIAINENEYEKYKAIIDYSYERTTQVPDPLRIYGYPVITDDKLKELAIKNISNFIPAENEIVINQENYDTYLTNSYLDTTQEKKEEFNILLWISLTALFLVIVLFILTIIDKEKIVNNLDEKLIKRRKKGKKR